jgi:ABC-type glycerol-3-phosphate transport system permease component
MHRTVTCTVSGIPTTPAVPGAHWLYRTLSGAKNVALAPLAVATVLPFVWMIFTSLKTKGDILAHPASLLPEKFVFDTYINIWHEVPFAQYFLNSFIFATSVTVIAPLFNFILILATMMIPLQVTMLPLFLLINKLDMYDTYHGLIIPRAADAFGIFLMRQFFLTLPSDGDILLSCRSVRWQESYQLAVYRSADRGEYGVKVPTFG